jgi:hypothetical protein
MEISKVEMPLFMKNRIASAVAAIVAGLLVALGPQFLFVLCEPKEDGSWMTCHWTGQAELGVGFLIALLGIALLIFADNKVRLGLSIAISLARILALLLPTVLIGGCAMEQMQCRVITFPSLIVISTLTIVGFTFNAFYLLRSATMQNAPPQSVALATTTPPQNPTQNDR